ncbi:NTF2 domain-containing protein [Entamoeba marina]
MSRAGFPITISNFGGTEANVKQLIETNFPNVGIISIKQITGDSFQVTVQNTGQAQSLMNLNNVAFNGIQLQVVFDRQPSNEAKFYHTMEKIKTYFTNIQTRSLDLSGIQQKLLQFGYQPQQNPNKLMDEIIKYFREEIPDLRQLCLSKNDLSSPHFLQNLIVAFKEIEVLDLSQNSFNHPSHFRVLKRLPLKQLFIYDNHLPSKDYVFELTSSLPSLKYIDNTPTKQIRFESNSNYNLPTSLYNSIFPPKTNFFEVYQFMEQFFSCHDQNIQNLQNVYNNSSIFTVTLSNQLKINSIRSRNLLHNSTNEIINTTYFGQTSILKVLTNLGKTTHCMKDLCLNITIVQLAFAECYNINIIGDLEIEKHKYQFCRSILLNTSPNLYILNDHLHLYPNVDTFSVVQTYSGFLKIILNKFPGIKEKEALQYLERNAWNIPNTEKEIATARGIQQIY